MPMHKTKLFSFAILVKRIQFEANASAIRGQITANIKFLRFPEQMLFGPVNRPPSNVLDINIGKSYTFGLSSDMVQALAKQFIIDLCLQQVDPYQRLSDTRVDITKKFREIFKNPCPGSSKTKVSQCKS